MPLDHLTPNGTERGLGSWSLNIDLGSKEEGEDGHHIVSGGGTPCPGSRRPVEPLDREI